MPEVKKVYSTQLIPLAGHVKAILEAQGIECILKNDFLAGAAGELPPIECWPEVWILQDDDYDEATAIVAATTLSASESGETWTCPRCEEELEAQFTNCWKCGAAQGDV